ncbi:MAG: hypothetical protein LBP63_08435 [Prevotellaceae bacterium]|nr:hypothetical protein [Prevotellaceae bacterium]
MPPKILQSAEKTGFSLLKKDTEKGSFRTKRLNSACNKNFLTNLLKI